MKKYSILLLLVLFIIGCGKAADLNIQPNDTYDHISKIIPLEKADFNTRFSSYLSKELPQNVMGIDTRNLQIEEVRYDFDKRNRLCAFYMTITGKESVDKLITRIDGDNRFLRLRDDYGIWSANTEELAEYISQVHVIYDVNDTNKAVMSIEELWQCFNK